jgi:L-fuconolactonase
MTIDSHHHFWNYSRDEYGWIDDAMSAIRRDFLPADLAPEIERSNVDAVVSVQARQSLDETRWLLDLARANAFVAGVVGWVPLVSPAAGEHLDALTEDAPNKLVALRHVLQAEPDDYPLDAHFTVGLRQLALRNMTYDILILERQLPTAIALVDRHPNLTFVLDHLAKPRIRDGVISPWRENIRELAKRPNVYAKISGMVTEADYRAWTPDQLRPYVDVALESFGPRRLMFGSDWPVCLVACEYGPWVQVVRKFIEELSPYEQADIMGNTAGRAYRL